MTEKPAPGLQEKATATATSIWRSKVLLAAIGVTAIGAAMWVYAAATASPAVPESSAASAFSSQLSATAPSDAAPKSRLIDDSAPAVFRLGLSFIVGYFFAVVARKFIKITLLVAGLAALGIYGLRKAGVDVFDWSTVEGQVDQGVEWAKEHAGAARSWVMGYMPSAASAVVGMFFGARRG
ncbi:MAG: hypothetical protein KF745_02535 [Phycisphaeraceae bacterium]|nr:hypothetical protein [Phycisphaeraceae bacterium]